MRGGYWKVKKGRQRYFIPPSDDLLVEKNKRGSKKIVKENRSQRAMKKSAHAAGRGLRQSSGEGPNLWGSPRMEKKAHRQKGPPNSLSNTPLGEEWGPTGS